MSRTGVAEFVAADHRIDSDGPDGCIVKHQKWGRGDVGEHIGINCDAVSSLIALDVRALVCCRGRMSIR